MPVTVTDTGSLRIFVMHSMVEVIHSGVINKAVEMPAITFAQTYARVEVMLT